jgi:NADH dehydrogenase
MANHVIVIGGGFGGLEAAFSLRALLKPPCEITLVDRSAFHTVVPSIHEIVSGRISMESIRIPLAVVLNAAGIRFEQDEVLSIDQQRRTVQCRGTALHYDHLVVATGAESTFFGVPGAEEFSYQFRTAEHAVRIRNEVIRLLDDPHGSVRIVLAGGGTEGVEVAGALLDLIKAQGRDDEMRSGRVSIDIIDGKEHLLNGFIGEAQQCAESYLKAQGVNVITGQQIVEVRKDSIVLGNGDQRGASVLVWTGGIQPAALIRDLHLRKDEKGWLRVTDRLCAPDDDRIYGIGDAVSIYDERGPIALQRLAYHAQDQARVAALNISYQFSGRERVAYSPKSKPQLISLGKDMGIFTQGERVYSGPWVVSLKKAVERKHLMGYLSRPVASALWSRIPGAGLLYRLRMRLPV